jgi:hypothetical protein
VVLMLLHGLLFKQMVLKGMFRLQKRQLKYQTF